MPAAPVLRRNLRLWDLVLMGIIMIQPTAPMPIFGVVSNEARGHVVTTILIAMVAMLFTAISYGRMARAYPSAGSAYTYVGQEVHPALGFLAGWGMLMDYVLNPLICTVWCAKAALNISPAVPEAAWKIFFALLFTFLNIRRIESSAKTNQFLAGAMGLVILWMLGASGVYLMNHPGVDWWKPFYDPATFQWKLISSGTALAVLTYIGFDGISTLSEEVQDPRRNILLGTVIVCLVIGVLSAVEVYVGQLVWPYGQAFPDVDTAYVYVAGRAGGPLLFQVLNFTLLVATIGSGAGAQMAGGRLLFGMGRDGVLPRKLFGEVDAATGVPRNAVLVIGAVALAGAFLLSYEQGAALLNFGAFIGFMGVNLAALIRYWVRGTQRRPSHLLVPAAGFLICGYMWISLSTQALATGTIWAAIGLAFGYWKTKGFRQGVRFEAPPE